MSRKKLLVVSHACVVPVNQLLFCALGQLDPELDITLLIPSNWKNEYTGKPWPVKAHPDFKGTLKSLPVWISGHISLHFYGHGIVDLLRSEQPDWIYLDEEPWAIVTQQIARLSNTLLDVPFLFHTNQNLQKRYPFPFSYCERWVFDHAAHAFPVGEEAVQVLRNKGYQHPLTVFPYGIDEALYAPHPHRDVFRSARGVQHEQVVFGYLGRFVEEKGLLDLIKAFYAHWQTHPQSVLWLVGGGPQEAELKALVQSLGLADGAIQFLAAVPHEKAPEILSAFDVFVLPSLTRGFWKEQFGRVIIEALACGACVIGSDSGEIPHLIGKLSGGLVFPEGDVPALADAMGRLAGDSPYRQTLAAQGRQQVLAGYTNSQLAGRFREVLETLG